MDIELNMKALGMICGIGSMLIGAKRQGYDIVGNIEWRPGYWTGTFEHNFPGAFMAKDLKSLTPEQLEQCKGIDYMAGHTECGNFSPMNMHHLPGHDPVFSDIPNFAEAVRVLEPKVFAMDNLPPSLFQFGPDWWAAQCPGYDIDFEWVSNFNYGNPQKHRKRLFVIGAKSDLGFYFIPGEKPGELTDSVGQRLRGLAPDAPNHFVQGEEDWQDGFFRYMTGLSISTPRTGGGEADPQGIPQILWPPAIKDQSSILHENWEADQKNRLPENPKLRTLSRALQVFQRLQVRRLPAINSAGEGQNAGMPR